MKTHPRTLYVGAPTSVVRDALSLLLSEALSREIAVVAAPQLQDLRLGENDAILWCGTGEADELQSVLRRGGRGRRVILTTDEGMSESRLSTAVHVPFGTSTEDWLQRVRGALHLTLPSSAGVEAPLKLLGEREREVFRLLVDGIPNRSIAAKLKISPRTVETHRARILHKLDCASNAELVRYAVRHQLLDEI